jgi:transcription initiation factor TFIIIB Brf1 subunit/transcription initiation factor TFIIB
MRETRDGIKSGISFRVSILCVCVCVCAMDRFDEPCYSCRAVQCLDDKDGVWVCTSCGVVQPWMSIDISPERVHTGEHTERADCSRMPTAFDLMGGEVSLLQTRSENRSPFNRICTVVKRYSKVGTGVDSYLKGERVLAQLCRVPAALSETGVYEAKQLWLQYCELRKSRRDDVVHQEMHDQDVEKARWQSRAVYVAPHSPSVSPGSTRNYGVEVTEVPAIVLHVAQMHGQSIISDDLARVVQGNAVHINNKVVALRKELGLTGPSIYTLLVAQTRRLFGREVTGASSTALQLASDVCVTLLAQLCVRARAWAYSKPDAPTAVDPAFRQKRYAAATLAWHVFTCLCTPYREQQQVVSVRMGNDRGTRVAGKRRRVSQLISVAAKSPVSAPSPSPSPSPLPLPPPRRTQPLYARRAALNVPVPSPAAVNVVTTRNTLVYMPARELVSHEPMLQLVQPLRVFASAFMVRRAACIDREVDEHETKNWDDAMSTWMAVLPLELRPGSRMHGDMRATYVHHLVTRGTQQAHAFFSWSARHHWTVIECYLGTVLHI